MKELLFGGSVSLLSIVLTYLFTFKKRDKELIAQELSNLDKVMTMWKELAQEQRQEVAELRKGQLFIAEENGKLKAELIKLEDRVGELIRENKKLRAIIEKNQEKWN